MSDWNTNWQDDYSPWSPPDSNDNRIQGICEKMKGYIWRRLRHERPSLDEVDIERLVDTVAKLTYAKFEAEWKALSDEEIAAFERMCDSNDGTN
jgi:hypothetical protein